MSVEKLLVEAIAQLIHQAGVGVWRPNGVFTSGETAVMDGWMPDKPDRVIVLTPYDIDEEASPELPNVTHMIQVRYRTPMGRRTDVDDLAAQVHALIASSHPVDWPGLRIQACRRHLVAQMGFDDNRRPERADSYQILLAEEP